MKHDQYIQRERARSALLAIDAGCERSSWVRIGMSAKAAGLDFDDFHDWSSGAANYKDKADCQTVWNSFGEGGITAASLFRFALDAGWQDDLSPLTNTIEYSNPLPVSKKSGAGTASDYRHDPNLIWDSCSPADSKHPYITRKLGLPDGLRVLPGNLTIANQSCIGALVLPCSSLSGELATLQLIAESGKLFLPKVRLPADACLVIGGPLAEKPIYLVEGIGQAWSAHQATGCPAVVCFGWGRVNQIAQAIRSKHPNARLVILPDAGKEAQAEAIARDFQGAWVAMPTGSPKNYDLNDYHLANGLKAVTTLLEQAREAGQRYHLLTPAELAALPSIAWRIRGVLPQRGIAALFGPSGSGKSFLALDMLAAMTTGKDWFGCKAMPCPVLYAALEGEAGISQRIQAYQMKHGPLPSGFRFLLQAFDMRKLTDRADLISAARAAGYSNGVLIIDTLNRAAPGADENDSAAMGEIIDAAKQLQAELGGLVLLVHHTGKDASKGLRGHSSLHAALDAAVVVTREGDRRKWATAKAKDGDDLRVHPFRLNIVEIGAEDDGEPITSCVITPEEDAGEFLRLTKAPQGGNQLIVWNALGELFRSSGLIRPPEAPIEIPSGRPCLRLDEAIIKVKARLPVEPARQAERAQLAIKGLITKGLVRYQDKFIWCT